ncbi:MAG: tetratricopeptide repeat protein [Betaproteobacteria bacterium]
MGLFKSAVASIAGRRESPSRASASKGVPAETPDVDGATSGWEALLDAGMFSAALAEIDRAIVIAPDDGAAWLARATILRRWGRHHEAEIDIGRAAATGAGGAELARNQGWAAMRIGSADVAVAAYRRALDIEPGHDESTIGLATALQALGSLDEAAGLLQAQLERAPDDLATLLASGSCEIARKSPLDAERRFRRAVGIAPLSASAHEHLGVALAAMDRHAEALERLTEADALAQGAREKVDAFANMGIGLCGIGRTRDGIQVLEQGLRERPNLNGSMQLGPALLSQGRFLAGWRHYEHRWLTPPLDAMRADHGVPQWMGQPLEGKTILVRAEQGLGDVFQFVRYLPLLKARGARVLFQPLKGMDRFARRFPGVDHVVREGELLPEFAYFANLMSLPLAFGTRVATIPCDIPYLSPDPEYLGKWARRFAARDKPCVGLTWAGRPEHPNDRHRSLRLEQLAPILAVDGVRFVSLQKGPAAAQAERVPESVDWMPVGAELDDLDDATAVLARLDLLICVDTGLAHLSGAMGRPVWMLLPTPAEYRWMTEREDTPWYPTLRLFRQRASREWEPVIARVARSLADWRVGWPHGREVELPAPRFSSAQVPPERPIADAGPIPGLAMAAETRSGFIQFVPDEPRIGPSLEYLGEWMQPRVHLLLRFVRPGMTIVEAGAGVGAHSIPLARAVGTEGSLLLYEARRPFHRLLGQNLAVHALWNATVMERTLSGPGERCSEDRETIDELRLPRLDGLKGNEGIHLIDLLAGARETIWRCRPWLMLASDDPAQLDRSREMLREFGYHAWRMRTPAYAASNFNRRTDDVFDGAVGMALFAVPEEIDLRAALPGCEDWP